MEIAKRDELNDRVDVLPGDQKTPTGRTSISMRDPKLSPNMKDIKSKIADDMKAKMASKLAINSKDKPISPGGTERKSISGLGSGTTVRKSISGLGSATTVKPGESISGLTSSIRKTATTPGTSKLNASLKKTPATSSTSSLN